MLYNLSIVRIFIAFLLSLPLTAAQPFTLEQVLSSPFPSNIVASPHGDAVAWVQNAKGVRNIWAATAPDFTAHAVTRFTSDDGQDLDEIAWKADATGLYFTRGGDVSGRGDFPNPQSDAAGVQQEVWMATIAGDAHKVGNGHSPAPAPDGSSIVWIYSGQIWSTGSDSKPVQLVHARGYAQNLTWSPDSTRIGFTSNRTDHSFIGSYSVREKKLNWLDASVDSDQSPAWSPDGKRIAFIRIPASRYGTMHGAKRTGQPWSIRLADAQTGIGIELWHADAGMGSVFWPMSASNQLLWGAAGRIVFPWERDGWQHLYSIATTPAARPTLLTPGNFEIEHVTLTPDGSHVLYSSNQDDTDRRHLWTVPVLGGAPKRLIPGNGSEWAPAALVNSAVAYIHANAKQPARAAIQTDSALRDLTPSTMPADFPAASLVEPEAVIISAADGMRIHGQLFLPPAGAPRHPAVIFFHGGSRRQMLLGWHNMFYYHQAYGFNQYLASKGYVVLSVNYRSGIGYGEEFREALHYGPTGASEYNDVIGAGLYLRSRIDVDPARIALWGGSYGGYLTALGLARASDMFAAGVDFHGVHDWNLEIANPIPAFEPEKRLAVFRTAFESSPMSSVASWRSPVLLIHGDDDRNVPFPESIQLAEALRSQGVEFEQLIFPDEIHDFLVFDHWLKAYTAAASFLDRHLRN